MLAFLMEPVVEKVFGARPPLYYLVASLFCLTVLAGTVFLLPGAIHFKKPHRFFLKGFSYLYLSQELRKFSAWLSSAAVCFTLFLLPKQWMFLTPVVVQFSLQRALYGLRAWTQLFNLHTPSAPSHEVLDGILLSQLVQWLAVSGTLFIFQPLDAWKNLPVPAWEWWIAMNGVLVGAASVVLEGDAGKPLLVQFISLATGLFSGFLCFFSPWFFLGVVYFYFRMRQLAARRLASIEAVGDDLVVS